MITNLYDAIGGDETIRRLVNAFYARVAVDPDLSPLFPEGLKEVAAKQHLFLTQFTGGPSLYTQVHGQPRMRARHLPFAITPTRRDAWLRNMAAAMDEIGLAGEAREELFERLTLTARHMENTPEP
jgi:hemoglobin